MKNLLSATFISLLILEGCGPKSQEQDKHKEGGNQELYEEVMNVHDEVMPKMNDIYKLKEELKKQIADTSPVAEEKKKAIQSVILELDSANEGMMVWMRNFDPLPDSLGEEKARAYLLEQKKKVEKVKEDILNAIDEAKAIE